MNSRICVVTGATLGIGREVARMLAGTGTHVHVLGRNERNGLKIVSAITRQYGRGSATFHPVDLAEFSQVRRAAETVAATANHVDILVNNAGARNDGFVTTSDGHELTFAANHLGHFLLTCLLLDRLRAAPAARIVTVSSGAHGSASAVDEWEMSATNYDRRQAYARSKLANIMFTYSLAGRLRGSTVTSNAIAPGGVASAFSRNNGIGPWLRHLGFHALKRDLVSPATAARAIVRLCTAPELELVNGRYLVREAEACSSAVSHDHAAAERLWRLSVERTALNADNCRSWDLVQPAVMESVPHGV